MSVCVYTHTYKRTRPSALTLFVGRSSPLYGRITLAWIQLVERSSGRLIAMSVPRRGCVSTLAGNIGEDADLARRERTTWYGPTVSRVSAALRLPRFCRRPGVPWPCLVAAPSQHRNWLWETRSRISHRPAGVGITGSAPLLVIWRCL